MNLLLYVLCIKCVVRMSIKIAVDGGLWDVGARSVTRHDSDVNRRVWRGESMGEEVWPSIGGQKEMSLQPVLSLSARLIKTRFADSDKSNAWGSESVKRVLWVLN
jgi:hypothetical protein